MKNIIITLTVAFLIAPAVVRADADMMSSGGMMGFYGGFWSWFMVSASLVWLVVGVLAAVWLWKQIIKK